MAGCWLLVSPAAADPQTHDWTGFHVGVNAGGALGSFYNDTSSNAGSYFGLPFIFQPSDLAEVNALGTQTIHRGGVTGGVQFGHDWQWGNFVAGLEADVDYLQLGGSSNGGALFSNGEPFLISSYGRADWMAMLRPRLGYAVGNSLFYATGGLVLADPREDFFYTDGYDAYESATRNSLQAGYSLGVGVEWALSDRLSVKAEYLHVGFGTASARETDNFTYFIPEQTFAHTAQLSADIVRVGINYHFGDFNGVFDDSPSPATPLPDWLPDWLDDWQVEVGAKLWANNGKIGGPNPLYQIPAPPYPPVMLSRLTYSGLGGIAGETDLRVDHGSGFFIKGFLGAGAIGYGRLNDEDFPNANVYSNTLSSASGNLGYADVDLGYSFLRTDAARIGAFVGYDYYSDHVNATGCMQLADDFDCSVLPQKGPLATQDDSYNSLRLGLSTRFFPADRLRVDSDIAYMPSIAFAGYDDHNYRQLLLPEQAAGGDGAMLEASVDYLLTDAWSIGVGGRYWTWNSDLGSTREMLIGSPPGPLQPARYDDERYGLFLQTDYRFGGRGDGAAASGNTEPYDWTGIFAGGTLGAGFSNSTWADPYGATTYFGYTNAAGFGDRVHATGALAGLRLDANRQIGNWVVGLEGDRDWANLRGTNTCYSGLGGVGCAATVYAVSEIAARAGYAWARSLAFLKFGGAWVATEYGIFGNTPAYYEGTGPVNGNGVTRATSGGWVTGAGLEFAVDDHWTTSIEYNRIGGLGAQLSFPTVTVLSAAPHGVSQTLDIVAVGLSYKLD